MLVMTSDGDEIGRIKEMDATCIKVDRSMQIDLWLNKDTVDSTEFGAARLNLPEDAFNQRTGRIPGSHAGIHLHE